MCVGELGNHVSVLTVSCTGGIVACQNLHSSSQEEEPMYWVPVHMADHVAANRA